MILALNVTLVQAQTVYDGEEVQAQLLAAIAAGQSVFTLPPGPINLTRTLVIPPGTRNFTMQGQSGTRLVRNSTVDFGLVAVGSAGWHAFSNSAFSAMRQSSVAPILEGDAALTFAGGQPVVPGWYCILGTDPANDIVTSYGGGTTYNFRRELVRVKSVSGSTIVLDGPVGRDFNTPELRLVEADTALPNQRLVCQGITLRNLILDGKSSINNSKLSKIVVAGLTNGLLIDDVSVQNFNVSGISVLMSKGISVNRMRQSAGNLATTGYGIEFDATRFATVRNSTFSQTRTGILWACGSMDGLVEDCSGPVNFDASHGMGEQRITYRRCLGAAFTIANPSFRRGVDRVLIEDCTATDQITIYGNSSNVVIRGKYPGQAITTPIIYLGTEVGGGCVPSAPSYPLSVTLEGGVCTRSDQDGANLRQFSLLGAPKMLGNLTIKNWTFRNLVSTNGSNISFEETANSPIVNIENCQFTNTYEWSAPIYLGTTTTGNLWNLTLRNNSFQTAGTNALMLALGASAAWLNEGNSINQTPVTVANVRNPGGLQPAN